MATVYIYTLEHPVTGEVRYVGKTINLKVRMQSHLRETAISHKVNWMKGLRKQGLEPVMQVLDEVPEDDWRFWEVYWIAQVKAWGFSLCNMDGGGGGQGGVNLEVRQKQSRARMGRRKPCMHVPYAQYTPDGKFIRSFSGGPEIKEAFGVYPGQMQEAASLGILAQGFRWVKITGEVPATIPSRYNAQGKVVTTNEERIARAAKSKATRELSEPRRKETVPRNRGAVLQLSLDGTPIKLWKNKKEAFLGTGISSDTIKKALDGNAKRNIKFLWKAV